MATVTIATQWITLFNVHELTQCEGEHCVIHNPSAHHMRAWTLHWRDDRHIFERLCPAHGTGHPDPDQFAFWEKTDQEWQKVHGCCGCCRPKPLECPTCTSPNPKLHPAVQHEGEVHICNDTFHNESGVD
ncbi:hypothetical protein SEA_FORZA_186 [Gordonia phage Forza]|uniref:Uncharacterized protein n=1 Tax=Gordonia phage Forza TaxID=2571247 RepID=A0A650EYA5_9CAUD|nr:hypothetical protein PP303_gp142 [Gordonia phage Forza]QGT55147.1 hypothetical protein SEA_FORZA_186 [Gordonia phage Forza]UXE04295.1 hypothetical protein SEA_BLUENGOLD_182 [Gordonia phage BlueNGold]